MTNNQTAYLQSLVNPATAVSSVASGNWSNPATWQGGAVPTGGDILISTGTTVTVDGVLPSTYRYIYVQDNATLQFQPDVTTGLTCDTLITSDCATLTVGTDDAPITALATITFAGPAIDATADPYQLTRGLQAMGGMGMTTGSCGFTSIVGQKKTAWATCGGVSVAANSVTLNEMPVNWQQGDKLLFPSSGDSGAADEQVTITGVVGKTVSFTPALKYNHTTSAGQVLHVANLTRNIVFQSASYSPILCRGHVMFMHTAAVIARYAAFLGLGRTDKSVPINDPQFDSSGNLIAGTGSNPRARYSFHFHIGGTSPTAQVGQVEGCVVNDSPGWGFDLHGSKGNLDSNIAYLCYGAGLVTERGDEVGSFTNNLSVHCTSRASGTPFQRQNIADFGFNGWGFWFQGTGGLVIENNVAIGHKNAPYGGGFMLYPFGLLPTDPNTGVLGTVQQTFPAYNLADTSIAKGATSIAVSAAPTRRCSGNIAYNCEAGQYFERGSYPDIGNLTYPHIPVLHVLDGGTCWRCGDFGVGVSYSLTAGIQNFTIQDRTGIGLSISDEGIGLVSLTGNRVTNCTYATKSNLFGGTMNFTDNTFDCATGYLIGIVPNHNDPQLIVNITRQTFGTQYGGANNIVMEWSEAYLESLLQQRSAGLDMLFRPHLVFLDGQQVYWQQQDPNYILFPTANATLYQNTYYVPSALIGITNQQMWTQFGICMNGSLAPSGYTTPPGIVGLVGAPTTYNYDLWHYGVSYSEMFPRATGAYTLNVRNLATQQIVASQTVMVNPGWNMYTLALGGYTRSYFVFGPVS